jgi:WD40 repeat protein
MPTPKRKLIKTSFDTRFSPNGEYLASLSRDVVMWSCPDTKKLWRAHPLSHPSHVAFSTDSSLLVVKSTTGQRRILSSAGGEIVSDFKNQSRGEGGNILFADDGSSIVDASWSGWHSVLALNGEVLFEEHFASEMVTGILRHPSGRFWFRHQRQGPDLHEGTLAQRLIGRNLPFSRNDFKQIPIPFYYYCDASFSPDGEALAILSGHSPNVLTVFAFPTMQLVKKIELPAEFRLGQRVRYSPVGDIVAVIGSTLFVCLSAKDLSIQAQIAMPNGCSIDFSPTGSLVAVGSWSDGEVFRVEEVAASRSVPLQL